MEMREWLSIIVIIAIVLIVADGFRRKRKERNPVKMKLDRKVSQTGSSDDDEASAELPHGGARTIPRDLYRASDPSRKKVVRGRQQRKVKMERTLDLEEKVPVLMDSVAIQPEEIDGEETPPSRSAGAAGATGAVDGRGARVLRNGRKAWDDDDDDDDDFDEEDEDLDEEDEDDFDEDEDEDDDYDDDEDEEDFASTEYDGNDEFDEEYDEDNFDEDEDEDVFGDEDDDYDEDEDDEDLDDEEEDEDFGYDEDEDDDNYARFGRSAGAERIEPSFGNEAGFSAAELENGRFAPEGGPAGEAAARAGGRAPSRESQVELPLGTERAEKNADEASLGDPEEVIVINVMARKGENFAGRDMLPVIMKQGLRLGDMSIFHRHADSSGNGPVIFSMANMVKPGTFDMAGMEDFSTPGVSLFQQLPGPISNMKNFDRMLATATALRDALNGELKDENRSVLTRQTIEHYRQRIRDFELRQLARK